MTSSFDKALLDAQRDFIETARAKKLKGNAQDMMRLDNAVWKRNKVELRDAIDSFRLGEINKNELIKFGKEKGFTDYHEWWVRYTQIHVDGKVSKKQMGKTQRNYFLGEKVKVIQNEIGQNENGVDEIGELEESLKKKNLPQLVREKAAKELK
mgnify:CR=1 FL=1